VTALYRFTGVELPNLGPRTVWTTDRESAKWLAVWQAAGVDLPASRVYHAEVPMDALSQLDVSDALRRIRDGSLDANGLLATAERRAPSGCRWLQLADRGRPWKGAILYLGDEPVPARPASPSRSDAN
jgi:hypothetical protein